MMTSSNGKQANILMVTARYYPDMGGTETHVDEVSRRMVARGAKVTVLTTDRTGQLASDEQINGVRILRVRAYPAQQDLYFAPGIYAAIRNNAWDIVHCQSYHTLVPPIAMAAARRANIPYLISFHSGGHSSPIRNSIRDLQVYLQRPLLRGADQLVGVSNYEAAVFSKRLGVPIDRFVVVPNGSNLPKLTEPVSVDTSKELILSVGRLTKYKGHQRIIEAMPMILKDRPDVFLRVLGVGPYEPELRQLAARLNIADRVTIGAIAITDRQGMASALAQASLVTLLSDYEAHPVSVMEALSLRRPVLVTATSGLQEIAERGLARSIPLTSTAQDVAAAVLDQLAYPMPLPDIELPTWDQCANRLLELYEAIIERRSA